TAVLAHFLVKGDRLSALKVLGLVLGLGGTVILIGAPETSDGMAGLVATALLALMAISWAIAAILQSRFLTRVAPIPAVALGSWASVVLLSPLALGQLSAGWYWTTPSILALAYLVVFGTGFAMVVSLWLYRKLRPTTITLIQVVVPAEAILIGTLWLGEPVTIRMLAGAALVVAAVALNAIAGGGAPPAEERLAATPAAADRARSAGVLFARPRWDRDGPPSRGRSLRRPRRCSAGPACPPLRRPRRCSGPRPNTYDAG